MTGYLQRLASSVISPGGNIHPLRNPVFSAPMQSATIDAPAEDPTIPSPGPTSQREQHRSEMPDDSESSSLVSYAPMPDTIESKAVQLPLHTSVQKPVSENDRPSTVSRVVTRQQPPDPAAELTTNSRTERQSGRSYQKSPIAISADHGSSEISSNAPAISEAAPTDSTRTNHRPQPYTPLVAQEGPTPDFAEAMSGTVKKPDKTRLSRSTTTPNREPDEIEIHIGRIEVTAIQPAAPAAPAKPRRLAPSLDEYLKRRNGRIS